MAKRSSGKRDFMEVARAVVEQDIGEHIDGTPLETPLDSRNPHVVALGQLGGLKGERSGPKISPLREEKA